MDAQILTLEEACNADIFWYEHKNRVYSPEYGRFSSWEGQSIAIVRLGESGYAFEDPRSYGSWWRCWDKKPTEEVRKATPWEEHENGCWNCLNYDWRHEACTIRWNNLDESYYNPDLDDRKPCEYCCDHSPFKEAVWDDDYAQEGE